MTIIGGAGSLDDLRYAVENFGVIGISAGSLFVFKGPLNAVLINYPEKTTKEALINEGLKNMLQILQNIKNGNTSLENIPTPALEKGCVLIKTTHSLVSLGTEKMLVEFSKSNIVQKAKMEPERVSQALNKIKTEGLVPTLETIFNKLDQPMPLGYCNVGEVIGLGKNVTEFSIGDRVVSNGPHAEIVSVPKNLVASIPESVTSEEAAFTVIGSVGLQGLRLLKPDMGETIVVYGLGLVGLITAQLLQLSGCKVVGIDLDKKV